MITSGARLESQVCRTQVIVVRATPVLGELRCGGAAMVPVGGEKTSAELDPEWAGGTSLGKRYTHETGAEILVTRAGAGTLAVGGVALELKQAKPLPASD